MKNFENMKKSFENDEDEYPKVLEQLELFTGADLFVGEKKLSHIMEFILNWRFPAHRRKNNNAYVVCRFWYKKFLDFTGDIPPEEMDFDRCQNAVQAFVDRQRNLLRSPVTTDHARRILSAMFSTAIRFKLVAFRANPADKRVIMQDAIPHRVKPAARDADVERLMACSRGTKLFPLVVLCLNGCRLAGASKISKDDIDFAVGTVRVYEKLRERHIGLSPWAASELAAHVADGGQIAPVHPQTAHKWFRELRAKNGLPRDMTFNSLRRACLKRMLNCGVPVQKAAAIAGNSMQIIQRHYVELASLDVREEVKCLQWGPIRPKK